MNHSTSTKTIKKKRFKSFLPFVIGLFLFSCTSSRPVKNCETYTEAADPDTSYVVVP